MTEIHIGGRTITFDQAAKVLQDYTAESNPTDAKPYAYPAYDHLDTGSTPEQLNDGDLLAPQLLNVQVKLSTFYSLQALRPSLEHGLRAPTLCVPLADQREEDVKTTVRSLYSVLDGERSRGLRGTTLSKVLHRKRPETLVLHDRNVRSCYLGPAENQVPRTKLRSWADYMTLLTLAIRHDIVTQREALRGLQTGLRTGVQLEPVRIVDILAWHLGGDAQAGS